MTVRQISENTYPSFLDSKPGRTASILNQEYLFFSGYNYLGMSHQTEFIELVTEGISRFGWLFPSSRISNTRLSLYEECEALLSTITDSEDTVLLPSGFTAGQLATTSYGTRLHNAPGSHPAIARNQPQRLDFSEWSEWLLSQADSPDQETDIVFASDSLSPLTATVHDFSFITEIGKPVRAILDDSHGIGILGKNGNGISGLLAKSDKVQYTFTYSLSKAFGISGGAISCSKQDAERFRSLPEYTAVSTLSPAMVYAFIKGQHIYAAQRQRLMRNIDQFIKLTRDLPGLSFDSRFPVFVLPPELTETRFRENNILISAFAYPDPAGTQVKRLVLNALHTDEDLSTLACTLRKAYDNIL